MKSAVTLLAMAIVAAALDDRTVFITPSSFNASSQSMECLNAGFYGRYGRPLQDVYIVPLSCAMEAASSRASGSMAYLPLGLEEMQLMWLQDAGVDNTLRDDAAEDTFSDSVLALRSELTEKWKQWATYRGSATDGQLVLTNAQDLPPNTLYLSSSSALIAIPKSQLPSIDTILPRFVVPIALPSSPLLNVPIDTHAIKRIRSLLTNLKFNPSISSILSGLNTESMYKDIRWLTGEAESSDIVSRHSFSSGARVAADWIQGEIEKSGAVCEQKEFSYGFAPNVICRYPAVRNTTATTILSAHYDSRGSFGSIRAPGGDDDGSGTTHVLAVARLIKERKIAFKDRFELVLFAGEEQGLVGSRAYAHDLREANANITLHVQADMLAYHSPLEPPQLGLPDLIGLPEAAYLVGNISKIYAPELTVGYTPACCSDHQSFHEQGFPATWVFERAGPIIDPMYHNSGDVSNRTGYDFSQLLSITKVTLATVLETTGFQVVEHEG
ncbi:hypothetical protein FRB99_003226 [Tulasnella sp. 403]|nr:hypothetical protein FRB99_003226 [Tulasnella sp. 403]